MKNREELIKHLQFLRKEDELWMILRDYEEKMYEFVCDPSPDPFDEILEMVLLCLKACTAKIILERYDWEPRDHTFEDFLGKVRPLLIDNDHPTPAIIKGVREEIWGYILFKLPLLLAMAEAYSYPGDIAELEPEGQEEEKSEMLYACVFTAHMEIILRRIEFTDLEDH